MANTIQWNAVRKEMVQKINRISHRRLNTKSGKQRAKRLLLVLELFTIFVGIRI